jgi:hypothetical protein
MRLGIIARSDNTGLGNQTKELVDMLNPVKIMLIDSTPFNRNKQHPEWYNGYECQYVSGFPKNFEVEMFLNGLDVVLTCETFYNKHFVALARRKKVKTILQYNYEFLDNLENPDLALPDILVAPSLWKFEDVVKKFGNTTKVVHVPPPTNPDLFSNARNINLSKIHKKILHIGGKAAAKDRNGTNTVVEMLKYSKTNYELVIKSQTPLNIQGNDPRLTIDTSSPDTRESLYEGYDAMVLPRRYGGLCLPMNEALLSSLPVFMTNTSPNNNILPAEWLADTIRVDRLMTRTMLNVYEANPKMLAKIIDNYYNGDIFIGKNKAFELGVNNFSQEKLHQTYKDLLKF